MVTVNPRDVEMNILQPFDRFIADVQEAGRVIVQFVKDVFHVLAESFEKRSSLSKIFKIVIHTLSGVGHSLGSTFKGTRLLNIVNIADAFFDFGDLVTDADELVNERYRYEKDGVTPKPINKLTLTATVSLFVADVMGFALWLDDLALISLSKISASLGQGFSKLARTLGPSFTGRVSHIGKACPLLAKVVAKISLLNVLRGVVAGAFAFLTVNEIKSLVDGIRRRDVHQIILSSMNLTSFVAEIALKVLAIAGCMTVPSMVAIGCVAAGFGFAALIFEAVHKIRKARNEGKKKEEMKQAELNAA